MLTLAAARHLIPLKGRAGVDCQNIHLISQHYINLLLEMDYFRPILHKSENKEKTRRKWKCDSRLD